MENASVLWLLFVMLINPGCSIERTLRSWVNPECGEICKEKNLTTVYVRADGPDDTLHYLWDFGGNPSVLLALTPPSTSMHISWDNFIAGKEYSVSFNERPLYTFGVILNKIIEFNDLNDTGLINTVSHTNTTVLHPEYFRWERKTLSQNDEFILLDMDGNSYHDTAMNISRYGSIKLSLRGYCSLAHSEILPHMLHTENSTQVDIILDHLETNENFTNSRFAVELLVVGEGDPDIPMFVDPKKSVDDEHTPGIFEVVEVRTPPYNTVDHFQNAGAYLQWRPVSYTVASRDVTGSTETVQYPPMQVANHTKAVKNSMLYRFYGERVERLLVQRVAVSFGTKGDEFYKNTKYATWTFLIGYGTPPNEQFSYLVIMIISIGLGLPALILAVVSIYICVRKMSKRDSEVYLSR